MSELVSGVLAGDTLRNGATVLATKQAPKWDNSETKAIVILALTSDHEFVTWVAAEDGTGTCWGHYFERDLVAAMKDFGER